MSKLGHVWTDDIRVKAEHMIYKVKANKLEGTDTCQVLLPCKYDGKTLEILVRVLEDGSS